MFALGAGHAEDEDTQSTHMDVAKGIAEFCHQMYDVNPTKLPSESAIVVDNKVTPSMNSAKTFLLRPGTKLLKGAYFL